MTPDNLKSPSSLGLRKQILKDVIMEYFPKQQWSKEYQRKNNTKATKVWENVAQTRLGGEFWTRYVIVKKAYLQAHFAYKGLTMAEKLT